MKTMIGLILIASAFTLSGCFQGAPDAVSQQQSNTDQEISPAQESTNTEATKIEYGDRYPEVLNAEVALSDSQSWRFSVTLSSQYDTPARYADAWRVLDAQDNELGIRILGHDHAGEQPFTRSGTIEIPAQTNVVYVEGRDQVNGWSGQRFKVTLPSADSN